MSLLYVWWHTWLPDVGAALQAAYDRQRRMDLWRLRCLTAYGVNLPS